VGDVGWDGDEIVAFRMHLPSKIAYHNAGPGNPRRGNILVWEQPLAARLKGEPLTLDTRVETASILYRTLSLFGITFLIVAVAVRAAPVVGDTARRESRSRLGAGRYAERRRRPPAACEARPAPLAAALLAV